MDTLIGKTISHYRIERELGRGGMGIVYLARDTRLNRAAAIKALPDDVASDRDRLARCKQEAQILASLSHPNIGAIYGLEESDGRRYLALEYVEGETLGERIARGPLPPSETVDICLQIAAGIEAAHEGGIIHRDLKPGNVKITPSGLAKVLDFGLAKVNATADSGLVSEDSSTITGSPATMRGVILGTTPYLSPEQARGDQVDRRTDIWSFGCTLFECLTGKLPFRGGTPMETIAKILERDPDWSALPAQTPPALLRLIQRCLEKDPKARLSDTGDARLELEELKASSGGSAVARAAAATPSVAVLPFVNMSTEEENEYFADGLSEELMTVLANIRGLRVVSRTSAFSFKGQTVDLATVAQKLNVTMVLEGSVRKTGNRLRITAQLVQVATDSHLWSQAYDRDLEDIFAMQEDIAQSVVKEVRAALLGEPPGSPASAAVKDEVSAAARGRGENAEAYRLYLQGRFFAGRDTQADVAKAIGYYRQALELDQRYALAWAGLSFSYGRQAGRGWAPLAEGYRRAREAAERSLHLEPDLPQGHTALGQVRMKHDWDWKGAESSMRRALELAPGNAWVAISGAVLASALGGVEEAIALIRPAVALDPLNANAHSSLGQLCLYAGLFDEAEAALRWALEIDPQGGRTHYLLGLVLLAQGRLEEALAATGSEPAEEFRLLGLALVHHAKGNSADSHTAQRELIEKYAKDSATLIAETFAYRGESDRAFEWLERAYLQRDAGLYYIGPNPLLRNLHVDSRWSPFLEKIGLAG